MTQKTYYAGIGSRETPAMILMQMDRLAAVLAGRGMVLRSGAAQGADTAFEIGATRAGGAREIFLPWRGFNGRRDGLVFGEQRAAGVALDMAKRHHPAWSRLAPAVQKMMGRNMMQILGSDLNDPVQFVVCWAAGSTFSSDGRIVNVDGGTGQAVRLAASLGIEVFNLAHPPHADRVQRRLAEAA